MKKSLSGTLYYGDNLEIMRDKIPADSVDLCYIDPPFNSKRSYFQIYNSIALPDKAQAQAFLDTWTWNMEAEDGYRQIISNFEGRFNVQTANLILGLEKVIGKCDLLAYLISITLRITEICRILKPTGSFYLHCDPTASHYLKLVCDAVFCPRGGDFRNEIVWCYRGAGYPKKDFGRRHDIIFRYSKTKIYTFNLDEIRDTYAKATVERFKHHIGNKRAGRDFGTQTLNPLGKQPDDWWEFQPIAPSAKERLGYPTQKPEKLMEKIIKASSNPGDVVFDAYCGCGTTIAVAERLGRKWIGIDITYQSISVILKRMTDTFGKKIERKIKTEGIPRDMASARALAEKEDDRLHKEFEKWALLTYTAHKAFPNDKKGGDKGIDGTAYFENAADTPGKMVFQVKSGAVKRSDIATLKSDMVREKADMAVFITLENPTKGMYEEAIGAGLYSHPLMKKDYPRIRIVSIEEMIEKNAQAEIPLGISILKKAPAKSKSVQSELDME